MARYSHLPIYNDFYKLSLIIIQHIRNFPRMFKYTLGSAMQNNIYEILAMIVETNSTKDKQVYIQKMIVKIELLQIQVRLCKDLNCFNKIDSYFYISESIANISKQLEGWRKALQKTP